MADQRGRRGEIDRIRRLRSDEEQSEPGQEFERAQRIASGLIEASDVSWLSKGFSAFLAGGGALPLERCLRLPRKDVSVRRASRDYWLRKAWSLFKRELSPWQCSVALASAVRGFARTDWPRLQHLRVAPGGLDELSVALFNAFRAYERVPTTTMQLHNIALHRRHS